MEEEGREGRRGKGREEGRGHKGDFIHSSHIRDGLKGASASGVRS